MPAGKRKPYNMSTAPRKERVERPLRKQPPTPVRCQHCTHYNRTTLYYNTRGKCNCCGSVLLLDDESMIPQELNLEDLVLIHNAIENPVEN